MFTFLHARRKAMKTNVKILGLVMTLLLTGQTEAAGLAVQPDTINLNKMAQNIKNDLNGKAVGYQFAITKNGLLNKTGAGGLARRSADGLQAMTPSHRMQLASVNKTLAAVAVLQLLEANKLSVNSPVKPWLPAAWTQGLGVWNGLTFKHLLTHTSGFWQNFNALSDAEKSLWNNGWDGMEFAVSNGAQPGAAYKYINMNFALFRAIVPALWKASPKNPGIGAITESNYDDWFRLYMQKYVFTPSGIPNVTCQSQAPAIPAAYGYDVSDPLEGGLTANVTSDDCGGHAGFHLSARNLAAFMAHLRYGKLLSPAMKLRMDSQKLGWQNASNSGTSLAGKYYHGGDWYLSGREWHTCIMKYPQKVEAVLLVNSKINGGKSQCTILKDAFNNAL